MASRTARSTQQRKRKLANRGKKRKNKNNRKGSTPKFPIHV